MPITHTLLYVVIAKNIRKHQILGVNSKLAGKLMFAGEFTSRIGEPSQLFPRKLRNLVFAIFFVKP